MAKAADTNADLRFRIRWYIRVRWFLLLAIAVPTLLSVYVGHGYPLVRRFGLIFSLAILAVNGIFHILSGIAKSRTYFRALATVILAFDIVSITYFIHYGGAIESRVIILYAIPILIAAPLFGRAGVYTVAVGSAVAYDSLILANFFRIIDSPNNLTKLGTNGTYVVYTIILFSVCLLLVGVVADYLTRLLLQKEKESSKSTLALQRAQALAHVGSWEWNVVTNTVTWSDELYRIFGMPNKQPLDYEGFLRQVHPDDRERVEATINRALQSGGSYSFEHRLLRPSKEIRIVHGEGKVVLGHNGRPVQMFGTSQDVTAERSLEAAKGDFVALASHQLRTPASGVRMLLAMLRDGYVDTLTPAQLQMVEEAYAANERMLRISDDLLNVAKLESGRLVLNKQQIELHLWLKNVVGPHKLLAREQRQRLQLEVPKGVWYLHADQERLAMVLDNLLSNARKYTPARGLIRVSLHPGKRAHKITVADSGSGMTRSEIANLFGKFTRLDNPASRGIEGTGLGLYLAKSIIDLHQGSIKVLSKPGLGSTFTITLPAR